MTQEGHKAVTRAHHTISHAANSLSRARNICRDTMACLVTRHHMHLLCTVSLHTRRMHLAIYSRAAYHKLQLVACSRESLSLTRQ